MGKIYKIKESGHFNRVRIIEMPDDFDPVHDSIWDWVDDALVISDDTHYENNNSDYLEMKSKPGVKVL